MDLEQHSTYTRSDWEDGYYMIVTGYSHDSVIGYLVTPYAVICKEARFTRDYPWYPVVFEIN